MIFSLSPDKANEIKIELRNTDVFCLFPSSASVQLPVTKLFLSVTASLKLKKNVLILEQNLASLKIDESRRWAVSPDYLWLAPRALSVLLEAVNEFSGDYASIKVHLTRFK